MDVYKYISGVLGIPSFLGWNDDQHLKNHTNVNYIFILFHFYKMEEHIFFL